MSYKIKNSKGKVINKIEMDLSSTPFDIYPTKSPRNLYEDAVNVEEKLMAIEKGINKILKIIEKGEIND